MTDDRHDPLWAVTKPDPARRPPVEGSETATTGPAVVSADVPTQAVPAAAPPPETPPVRRHELDEHLMALGVPVDEMPTVAVPAVGPETDPAEPADPAGDDTADGASAARSGDDTPVGASAPDAATPSVADPESEPTVPVAVGAPVDPVSRPSWSSPSRRPHTDPGDDPRQRNAAILTSPLLDPTPPGVRRVRVRRRHSWRRRILGLVGVLLLGVAGYYVISLFQVFSTGNTDHRSPSEVIVVLGAAQYDGRPSPQLQARLDHAVELYEEEVAPVVFVTGGKRPGDRFTEAETSRDYLMARGVPELAILMESEGTSTWESLSNVSGALDELGLDDVVIVTDPYHSLRAKLMGEELGLTAHVSPTRTSPVTGGANFWRHAREAGGVAVGRIIGFGRLDRLLS